MRLNSKRVIFPRGGQKQFLEQTCLQLPKGWDGVAALCRVHRRTLFDWRREKYTMNAASVDQIRRHLKISPGQVIRVHPYRHVSLAGRRGAMVRYRLYGNPGTAEGRSRGGKITTQRFRLNPEYARRLGFLVRKPIREPAYSEGLAELIGIVLGDGSLSEHQLAIYFNSRNERLFAKHVQTLIHNFFGISSALRSREKNCIAVVASGKSLVEFLRKIGLKEGDKISSEIDVPGWIFEDVGFKKACLRGLMDTDGCVFFHTHWTRGHRYRHMGLSFTSYSPVLLRSANRLFLELGFGSKIYQANGHVALFRRGEVKRYMIEIGTHNPHHLMRFQSYESSKSI